MRRRIVIAAVAATSWLGLAAFAGPVEGKARGRAAGSSRGLGLASAGDLLERSGRQIGDAGFVTPRWRS
jgi:hypothetical protein